MSGGRVPEVTRQPLDASSRGLGQSAWQAAVHLPPEVRRRETRAPYFDKCSPLLREARQFPMRRHGVQDARRECAAFYGKNFL